MMSSRLCHIGAGRGFWLVALLAFSRAWRLISVSACSGGDERGLRVSVPEPLGEERQGHASLVEVHGPRVALMWNST